MPYRETEIRHGQPLDYVLEKVERAITSVHFVIRHGDKVPQDVQLPPEYPATLSVRDDFVLAPAEAAFENLLKAYLAILDLDWWTPEYADRLKAMSAEELERELARASRDGSLIGKNWPRHP